MVWYAVNGLQLTEMGGENSLKRKEVQLFSIYFFEEIFLYNKKEMERSIS